MLLGRLPNMLSLDQKGRLVIPARIRDDVVNRDGTAEFQLGCLLDRCLYLHTESQHAAFLDAFELTVDDTKNDRRLKTMVHSSFVPVTTDKTGRITIPAYLLSKAGIVKEVVIIGMRERVELWGVDHFDTLREQNDEEFHSSLEHALARAGRARRDTDQGGGEEHE